MTPDERFHKYLDECEQCMNNPFNLCQYGGVLLLETAKKKPSKIHETTKLGDIFRGYTT